MITLGITGLMAAGKSHVCKAFEAQGIPIYDTDKKVKDLLNKNGSLKKEMIKKFGKKCYQINTSFKNVRNRVQSTWNRDYVVKIASNDSTVIDAMGVII